MNVADMVAELNAEIGRLTEARDALQALETRAASVVQGNRRGRPKKAAADLPAGTEAKLGRRTMSVEGKRRIADAQRKRWAAQKKAGKAASLPAKAKSGKKSGTAKANAKAGTRSATAKTSTKKASTPTKKTAVKSIANAPSRGSHSAGKRKSSSAQPNREVNRANNDASSGEQA